MRQMQNDPMPGIYSEAALRQDHAPISNPTGSTMGFWQNHHGHLTNTKYRSCQSYQEHAPESRTLFPNLFRGDNTINTKIDTQTLLCFILYAVSSIFTSIIFLCWQYFMPIPFIILMRIYCARHTLHTLRIPSIP